jgi:3-isopropylmalate dehydrogenase
VRFARRTFEHGGALLCGPVGGSAIYRMRRSLALYCKLTPIVPLAALRGCGPLAASATEGADILMVRENLGGLYQGQCRMDGADGAGDRRAEQVFAYEESQVRAIVETAAAIAEQRRGQLTVIVKPGGAASVSALWRSVATDLCRDRPLYVRFLEVDNAAYQVIADARSFDVVVAPNMFGDVLADTATLLLGSRGLSFSANFTAAGHGVYQTGHGAAHDIKGQDLANPLGQMQSLAMMLGESFGLTALAEDVREACDAALADGWRTRDVAQPPATRVLGTQAFAARVAEALDRRLQVGRTAALRPAVHAC